MTLLRARRVALGAALLGGLWLATPARAARARDELEHAIRHLGLAAQATDPKAKASALAQATAHVAEAEKLAKRDWRTDSEYLTLIAQFYMATGDPGRATAALTACAQAAACIAQGLDLQKMQEHWGLMVEDKEALEKVERWAREVSRKGGTISSRDGSNDPLDDAKEDFDESERWYREYRESWGADPDPARGMALIQSCIAAAERLKEQGERSGTPGLVPLSNFIQAWKRHLAWLEPEAKARLKGGVTSTEWLLGQMKEATERDFARRFIGRYRAEIWSPPTEFDLRHIAYHKQPAAIAELIIAEDGTITAREWHHSINQAELAHFRAPQAAAYWKGVFSIRGKADWATGEVELEVRGETAQGGKTVLETKQAGTYARFDATLTGWLMPGPRDQEIAALVTRLRAGAAAAAGGASSPGEAVAEALRKEAAKLRAEGENEAAAILEQRASRAAQAAPKGQDWMAELPEITTSPDGKPAVGEQGMFGAPDLLDGRYAVVMEIRDHVKLDAGKGTRISATTQQAMDSQRPNFRWRLRLYRLDTALEDEIAAIDIWPEGEKRTEPGTGATVITLRAGETRRIRVVAGLAHSPNAAVDITDRTVWQHWKVPSSSDPTQEVKDLALEADKGKAGGLEFIAKPGVVEGERNTGVLYAGTAPGIYQIRACVRASGGKWLKAMLKVVVTQ